MVFWRVLVSFWLALGVLQGIFQGLCIQKTWKNNGFLRVYKGIVWFICRLWWRVLSFSVQVCVDFVQKQWSNLGLKSGLEGVQDVTKIGFERFKKRKKNMVKIGCSFWAFLVIFWGPKNDSIFKQILFLWNIVFDIYVCFLHPFRCLSGALPLAFWGFY